jgi:DNA adenine methylase
MNTELNRAPFPYPGSKARHADWILEHIPEHRTYVEPFGGAAGVLFQKPESEVEVYNDRDRDLVQFFEVLRERPDDLVKWLEAVPYAREVHNEWAEAFYNDGHRPDDPVKRAGRFFALRYMQWGGKHDGISGFATPRDNRAEQFSNAVGVLKRFSSRLQSVYVESVNWTDIIDSYDSPQTVFYCDPPYIGTEGNYNGPGEINHTALRDILADIKGDVVISYDSVPPFYGDGWQVAAKDSTFQFNNADGTGHKDATEYLLMNFDADGEPVMSGVGQQPLTEYNT